MKIPVSDFNFSLEHYKNYLGKDWNSKFIIPIGFDEKQKPIFQDLSKDPVIVMSGATGSGKSNITHNFICSLVLRFKSEYLNFILVDCKRVEFNAYKALSNLFLPIAYCDNSVLEIFKNINNEVSKREKAKKKRPFVFIVIDEFSDLIYQCPLELEKLVEQIVNKGSKLGIGLCMNTCRPSTEVITKKIDQLVNSRIGFAMASEQDSMVIIHQSGCEKLLGQGDGLYLEDKKRIPIHFQAPLITDKEIENIINTEDFDKLFQESIDIIAHTGKCSHALLMRRLQVDYETAHKIYLRLEKEGYITESDYRIPADVRIDANKNFYAGSITDRVVRRGLWLAILIGLSLILIIIYLTY